MNESEFLDVAVRHLPGGLVLIDLSGRLRAVNQTAETLLALTGTRRPEADYRTVLAKHPKMVQALEEACHTLTSANRQELTTTRADGNRMVLGYGTLILKDVQGDAIGVGMTFQDITAMIPLMDSHRFLDIALKNLPGGLIFVDLQGKIRGVNQMAHRILGLTDDVQTGIECHRAFDKFPSIVKVLLSTCQSLNAANRQELTIRRSNGDSSTLGYGTLILRNPQGNPVGVGLTFQDITRYIPLPLQTEYIRLVDRFFTPFAVTMVIAAMTIGYAEPQVYRWAWGILGFLVAFNEGSVLILRRRSEWTDIIGATRLVVNFLTNVVLVYLLGTFWGPMWLLFVLTPVATALYANWKRTIAISTLSAVALLGIYYERGLEGSVGWGQAGLHAAFIIFISLFVNSIARMVMQIKSAGTSAKPKPASSPTIPSSPVEKTADSKLAA